MHAKYEASISYGSKVIANVKVDNRQTAVLSKFVGSVGQLDIFYECPTKNVRVSDQMSDRKYKNIHLVDEKKRNTSDH